MLQDFFSERLWDILHNKVIEGQAWIQEKSIEVVDRKWWKISQSTI